MPDRATSADIRRKWAYFVALLLVALTLGPAMAHVLELPNKLLLDREDYLTVQGIYRGWALLGIVVFGALLATLVLTMLLIGRRRAMLRAAMSFLCLVCAQAVFWIFTYPANRATANWTEIPAEWARLRLQWELSHAAGALFDLLALVFLILSVLSWRTGLAERVRMEVLPPPRNIGSSVRSSSKVSARTH